jgi:histidinol-phosphate phosphatase family protein
MRGSSEGSPGADPTVVFLDRDGTLNVRPPEHAYVTSERDFVWLPGATEAMARLNQAGYLLAVVSNQRGVARGSVSPEVLAAIEDRIQRDLVASRCRVRTFRYCTHDEDEGCDCRKPKPGMLLAVAQEIGVDLRRSWMVGDSESDIRAGQAAGCRTALIGYPTTDLRPDLVATSLLDATDAILRANAARS